jgi:hypothetical protein
MKPIYINTLKRKIFKKGLTNYFILSNDKNYSSQDKVYGIMYSFKSNFIIYISITIKDYFNLYPEYPEKWLDLGKIISVNEYLNSNGFSLIDFNSLINISDEINKAPEYSEHYKNAKYFKDLISVLQLVIAKWDDWN